MDKSDTEPGPVQASKVIFDKLDHIQARATALEATLNSLSEYLLGPKPKAEPPKEERAKPSYFVALVLDRLDEIYGLVRRAQQGVEDLRSKL